MSLLASKVALITGGASGIGRASVLRFVAEGARVIIADISDEAGEALADSIGDQARYLRTDVSDPASIEATFQAAVAAFGRLDIVYNNAGIAGDGSPMDQIDVDGFDRAYGVNVKSVLWGHKFAARQFRAQGSGGSIITTASLAALQGGWSPVAYTSSKHAVLGIIRQAAAELASDGIRSNAIAPGVIMTAIQAKAYGVGPERAQEFNNYISENLGSLQPMGRFGNVEDIASVALFLASDLASYVTGAVIPVDGGASATTQNTFDPDMRATVDRFLASR